MIQNEWMNEWMSKYAVWTTGNSFKYHGIKNSTKVGNETPNIIISYLPFNRVFFIYI